MVLRKMKKLVLVLLVTLLAVALAACGDNSGTTSATDGSGAPPVTDSGAPPTTENPDVKTEKTEDYTAVLRSFDWVPDDIDYSGFTYFGSGASIANDINKDYIGFAKTYYALDSEGNKTEYSSGEVRRLGTVGAQIKEDEAAKRLEVQLTPLEVRVESSWEKVTARAGSYLMFEFTANCPVEFYMTVTPEAEGRWK